jgi:hypothetical protein
LFQPFGINSSVHWHADGQIVVIDNRYRVDLQTGEVKSVERFSSFSPNGRYANRGTQIYDVAADTEFQPSLKKANSKCWLRDDRAVFPNGNGLLIVNGATEQPLAITGATVEDITSVEGCWGNYAVVYAKPNPDRRFGVVNLENGQYVAGPPKATQVVIEEDYAIAGVEDQEDVEARGTYLINLKTGETKKISPYPVSSDERMGRRFDRYNLSSAAAVILVDKNAVLFTANQHIWKADLSGAPAQRLVEGDDSKLAGGGLRRLQSGTTSP